MKRLVAIAIIAVLIFLFTYLASNTRKVKKALILSGLAAVLGFIGPYIVEYFEIPREEMSDEDDDTKSETEDTNTELQDTGQEDTSFRSEQNTELTEAEQNSDTEHQEEEEQENVEYITFMGGNARAIRYCYSS